MKGDSGLTKVEREMIAVVVSLENDCPYCIAAHSAALRKLAKDPTASDRLAAGYADGRARAAPGGDARLRGEAHAATRRDDRGGRRGAPRGGLERRGRDGHRRGDRPLQHVEPHGVRSRLGAEPRVCGALGAEQRRRSGDERGVRRSGGAGADLRRRHGHLREPRLPAAGRVRSAAGPAAHRSRECVDATRATRSRATAWRRSSRPCSGSTRPGARRGSRSCTRPPRTRTWTARTRTWACGCARSRSSSCSSGRPRSRSTTASPRPRASS